MWMFGAFIGGVLGYMVGHGAWAVGAIVGAVIGLGVSLVGGRPAGDRLAELERRLERLQDRLDTFDRRLGKVEGAGGPIAPRAAGVPVASPSEVEWLESAPLAPEAVPSGAEPEAEPVGPVAARAEAVMQADAETAAPEPVAPRRAPPPSERKGLDESPVWRWLAGGNTVVRVGVVILFFGVAFLLKYAQEHVRVPIELRLAGVAAGAIALLAVGWRLRERRPGYALALQGGGIGLLYLVIFAAFRLYSLLPPAAAFTLLVAVAACPPSSPSSKTRARSRCSACPEASSPRSSPRRAGVATSCSSATTRC